MMDLTSELIRVCRYVGAFEREALCCGPVTVPQCVVLQELMNGDRDIRGLQDFAGTSQSAMTRLVDGLERKGWVSRTRDPDDGRRVIVALTEDGTEQAKSLRGMTEAFVVQLLAVIPAAERDGVVRALGTVRKALERLRGEACC